MRYYIRTSTIYDTGDGFLTLFWKNDENCISPLTFWVDWQKFIKITRIRHKEKIITDENKNKKGKQKICRRILSLKKIK